MRSSLMRAALVAAVLAFAAAPALAATCTATPAAPVNKLPPKPAVPANVPASCLQVSAGGANNPECKNNPALAAYKQATDAWLQEVQRFVVSVKTWQGEADAYSTCIQNSYR